MKNIWYEFDKIVRVLLGDMFIFEFYFVFYLQVVKVKEMIVIDLYFCKKGINVIYGIDLCVELFVVGFQEEQQEFWDVFGFMISIRFQVGLMYVLEFGKGLVGLGLFVFGFQEFRGLGERVILWFGYECWICFGLVLFFQFFFCISVDILNFCFIIVIFFLFCVLCVF